jgi:glycosyltransferase involved in cell wall biosynthesis
MRTTVIIPSFDAGETLPLVLDALAPQIPQDGDREVLLIESSGGDAAAAIASSWPWVRVIGFDARVLPGRARNVGASLARGELLAFLDADAVPADGWLDALEAGMVDGVDVVAGSIVNGTPNAPWGTAGYLLEFLEWAPGKRAPLDHAASCNLMIRREALERAGGFPEDMWPGEDTVLTAPFANSRRLTFVPSAQVTHLNRTAASRVLAHQRRLGSCWLGVCRRVPVRGRWLARRRLAPLAVLGRVCALIWQLHRARVTFRYALRHAPRLALGLCAWGVGLAQAPPSLDSGPTA